MTDKEFDDGLRGVMGDRFRDETAKKPTVEDVEARIASSFEAAYGNKKTAQKPAQKPTKENETIKDAQWQPVKPDPNWMDNLKACVKWVGLFGGLSFLIFYWKQAGLMAESIAVPCIAVCTALAGFGCGKNAMRGANH